MRRPALLLALAWACLAAAPHPDSLSSTAVRLVGSQAHVAMRCQVLSLLEVIPDLDADGDGRVSAAEVDASAVPVTSYVDAHYRLFTGTDRGGEGGRRLRPDFVSIAHLGEGSVDGRGYRMGAVELELLYTDDGPIRDLLVRSTLFEDTSPGHIDMLDLRWEGLEVDRPPEHVALTATNPWHRSDPEGRGAFRAYLPLGLTHILGGWEHLLFVFALVLGSRRLRSVLGVVAAFTVAHSTTLALATLDLVDAGAPTGLVDALIALSIGYVGADVACFPDRLRPRGTEAFLFGLVHGFGFAAVLRPSLAGEAARPAALFGFNMGVELGLVPVALLTALVLARLPRGAADEGQQALAPRILRRGLGAAVAVAGLALFSVRV